MAALGAGAAVGRLWRCALRTLTPPAVRHQVKRFLLTEEILKLQEFQKKKLATLYNLNISKDVFFQSINENLEKNNILLKSELLALLHLCQTPADVEFAKQVIYRYQAENKNVMFGEYRFGPVVVRLCYELDLEDTAIALVKDQSLGDFFRDSTSYSILMDLLFTKGQYEKALDVLLEMRNQKVTFYGETYILAFAICYKLVRHGKGHVSLIQDCRTHGSLDVDAYNSQYSFKAIDGQPIMGVVVQKHLEGPQFDSPGLECLVKLQL